MVVLWISLVAKQNFHSPFFTDPVTNFARVHPHGQFLREILQNILDRDAALSGRPFQDFVDRIARF